MQKSITKTKKSEIIRIWDVITVWDEDTKTWKLERKLRDESKK